jgi:uncharacterized protein YgbK (DUF1537 family)
MPGSVRSFKRAPVCQCRDRFGVCVTASEILFLADDLSGAADCAMSCLSAGLETVVALDGMAAPPAAALAIDTDSRRRDREAACRITATMLRTHAGAATLVYKKIDSTLRGHFATELAACLAERRHPSARNVAIVAPAFPDAGRTTRGGQQYLNGEKVEMTSIWRNERLSGRAFLPDLLVAAQLRVVHIGLDAIRSAGLAQIMQAAAQDHDALACDAATNEDLAAIAIAGQGLDAIWVGSAGLARHLPAAAGLVRAAAAQPALPLRTGPVICAVGSRSDISRAQFTQLAPLAGVAHFIVAPQVLKAGPEAAGWAAQNAAIDAAMRAGQDIAVLIDSAPRANPKDGVELCTSLGRMLAPHLATARGLIATGGETARALLMACGVRALRVAAAVEPGIPLSYAMSGAAGGMAVITKAGAFGHPQTLLRCRDMLRDGAIEGVLS